MKALIALLFLPLLGAQTVSGPVLGLLPQSGGFRPLAGIPGASLAGQAVLFEYEAAAAFQDYAVAVAGGRAVVVRSDGAITAIDGATPGAARILFSPEGRAAGLYHPESGVFEVISGLPGAPVVKTATDLSALPCRPDALAVSEEGKVATACGGSLYLDLRPVAALGAVSAMAFHGTDIIVAGPEQVTVVRGGEMRVIAATLEGPPVAVASAAGRILVAAAARITVIAADGAAASAACDCAIAGLERLNGTALFRVTAREDRPAWIFDAGGDPPRFWFVPVSGEVAQ